MSEKELVKKKRVRRKNDFPWKELDLILPYLPTQRTCADQLGVSESTIEKRIREKYDLTFSEYREQKASGVKIKLVKKAIHEALNGNNALLIFCLKNYCGWSDRPMDKEEIKKVAHVILNIPSNTRE